MIQKIEIWPSEKLSTICVEADPKAQELTTLLNDMADTMLACKGVGLAAPQIGHMLRVIVLLTKEPTGPKVLKLVNPRITHQSVEGQNMREGCLSLPGYFEPVMRPKQVTVEALDETGAKVEINAEGALAQALQHEIDHLDGVVFVNHLSALKRGMALKKFSKAKKRGLSGRAQKD